MTDDELRALVAELAVDVLLLEMPMPTNPSPSVSGRYWTIEGRPYHDNGEPLELAMALFRDVWRRHQVVRLVAERGLPAEVVALAWDALPYESVPLRFGWACWRAMREPRVLAAENQRRRRAERTSPASPLCGYPGGPEVAMIEANWQLGTPGHLTVSVPLEETAELEGVYAAGRRVL